MKLFVHREDGLVVTNVWCENVPADFSDADVAYTVECLANTGDAVAITALPYIRVCMSNYNDGTRVYLDNA